jgi:hypothetical protein
MELLRSEQPRADFQSRDVGIARTDDFVEVERSRQAHWRLSRNRQGDRYAAD